jgi:hypothetical protein
MNSPFVELLEPELQQHGGVEFVLARVQSPDWSDFKRYQHDWRVEIPCTLRELWQLLSIETKITAFLVATRRRFSN